MNMIIDQRKINSVANRPHIMWCEYCVCVLIL